MKPSRTRNAVRWSLKFIIALVILASASLVEAQTIQTLYSFNWDDGAEPYAGLTLGNDGNLYGTTQFGGDGNYGTVFKMTTNGALTTLVSFGGTNGANPQAALTLANDGNFYGTTWGGGSSGFGTVFKMTTNGALTTLVSFDGTNGANPRAALTLANDGNFYGTTQGGAITNSTYRKGMGTVFKMTANGALTTLVEFKYTNGFAPFAALTLANDGNFYGTTYDGGDGNYGTVFSLALPVTPPQLTIVPSGPYVILTWPTNYAGYTSQSTTNLGSSAVWTTNSPVPVIVNGQNTVTNPISGTQQFFRLSQ